MAVYYNEFDKQKAAWLRELIARDVIAPGDVDERSIHDVRADDLRGYTQCHFFAGIGVWSYALRLAGWPDDRPVWTGSCPCPSFSCAGKGEGFDDARHLWPVWMPLIRFERPPVVFGEQADGAIGHGWLDLVSTDLEAEEYAFAAAVLGACSVGAPHKRQRLYFVADDPSRRCGERRDAAQPGSGGYADGGIGTGELGDTAGYGREVRFDQDRELHGAGSGEGCSSGLLALPDEGRRRLECAAYDHGGHNAPRNDAGRCDEAGELGDTESARLQDRIASSLQPGTDGRARGGSEQAGAVGNVADADGRQQGDGHLQRGGQHGLIAQDGRIGDGDRRPGPVNGFWRDADWIFCRDGKWRAVEAGTFPLAHGAPARVGRLRGYGDAICAEVAAEFVRAYMEATAQ